MSDCGTSKWENIKNRIIYLKKNKDILGDGVEVAMALTEEIESVEQDLQHQIRYLSISVDAIKGYLGKEFNNYLRDKVKEIKEATE